MVSLQCSVVLLSVVHGCSLTSAEEKSHTDQESIFCYNSKQQPPRDTKSIYWELRWHVCIIKCYKKVPEIQFHQLIYCPCIQKQRNKQRTTPSITPQWGFSQWTLLTRNASPLVLITHLFFYFHANFSE